MPLTQPCPSDRRLSLPFLPPPLMIPCRPQWTDAPFTSLHSLAGWLTCPSHSVSLSVHLFKTYSPLLVHCHFSPPAHQRLSTLPIIDSLPIHLPVSPDVSHHSTCPSNSFLNPTPCKPLRCSSPTPSIKAFINKQERVASASRYHWSLLETLLERVLHCQVNHNQVLTLKTQGEFTTAAAACVSVRPRQSPHYTRCYVQIYTW